MNPDTLTEVACSRMADMAERALYLSSVGKIKEATLLLKEGSDIARMLDNNEAFLVLCPPDLSNAC
jgi:hypothetical protein